MNQEQLNQAMRRGLEERIYSGAVLLVSHEDRTIFHEPYGDLGDPKKSRTDRSTLFDLASLTKVLATTPAWIVLAARQTGILDEPLTRWFPDCPSEKRIITPRLLLAHSSGLPAWRPYYLHSESADSMAEYVLNRILREPLDYEPGQRCIYSDLGFMLLARILGMETGRNVIVFSRQEIFEPLGLSGDLMFRPQGEEHRIALTRHGDLPGLVNDLNGRSLGGVSGHAGLFGTAEAVGRPAREILACLKGSAGLFHHETVKKFCTRAGICADSTRALGFDTPSDTESSSGRFFSRTSLGHTGFTGTSIWIDPEKELVVVLLTNRVLMGEADFRIKTFRPMLHDIVMKSMS